MFQKHWFLKQNLFHKNENMEYLYIQENPAAGKILNKMYNHLTSFCEIVWKVAENVSMFYVFPFWGGKAKWKLVSFFETLNFLHGPLSVC